MPKSNMDIRLAEETDIVALVDLFQTSVEVLGAEHYSPEQVKAWASRATEKSFDRMILQSRTFVATDDTGPIGFCGYEPDGRISALFLRHDRTGQGVGTALLQHVLDDAREHDIHSFRTEASKLSIPLFEKFGFQHSGTENIMVGEEEFERNLMTYETGGAA